MYYQISAKYAQGVATVKNQNNPDLLNLFYLYIMLRARRNEKEMKVKPATSFKLLTILIHKKIRQDSKQKNVSRQYLSSFCHKVHLKYPMRIYKTNPLNISF